MSDATPLTRGEFRKALEAMRKLYSVWSESQQYGKEVQISSVIAANGVIDAIAMLDEPTQCAHPTVTLLGDGKVGCGECGMPNEDQRPAPADDELAVDSDMDERVARHSARMHQQPAASAALPDMPERPRMPKGYCDPGRFGFYPPTQDVEALYAEALALHSRLSDSLHIIEQQEKQLAEAQRECVWLKLNLKDAEDDRHSLFEAMESVSKEQAALYGRLTARAERAERELAEMRANMVANINAAIVDPVRVAYGQGRKAGVEEQQARGAEPVAWMSRSRFQHDHGVATIVDGAERPTTGSAKWFPVYVAPVSQREPDARLKAQRDRAVALLRTMQIPWFYETAPHDDCVALDVLLAEIDAEEVK